MRREREVEDLIECRTLNEADPGQPVTPGFPRGPRQAHRRGHGPGRGKRRPGGPAIQRQAPAYHVRWLVVSELARRQGPAAPL
jgi:hypothetical protein